MARPLPSARGAGALRTASTLVLALSALLSERSAHAQAAVETEPAVAPSVDPTAPVPPPNNDVQPGEPPRATTTSQPSGQDVDGHAPGDAADKRNFGERALDAVSSTSQTQARDGRHELLPKGEIGGRFEFGSYGRVNVASDLRGRQGRPADIVAHGSRLDEESYAELEFRREDTFTERLRTRIVTTLAMFPPFFHSSAKIDNAIALRQLYAQVAYDNTQVWVGSRMYRGDDIYLLNWWPLDNQNTIGGGVGGKLPTDTFVAVHAGMQRLDNPWQYQTIPGQVPYTNSTTNVDYMDRPRMIQTLKLTQFLRDNDRWTLFNDKRKGLKAALYGELHQIASGVRRNTESNVDERLPADFGYMFGAQLTYFTGVRDTFVSLVARHAGGLAVYDPLGVPLTFNNEKKTSGASENLVTLSGNFEYGPLAVMGAGYVRSMRDAGASPTSIEKYDEGIALVRPQFYFTDHVGLAVEGSVQARRYALAEGTTGDPLTASLVRGSIFPFLSPAGRGSFRRPVLGAVYTITGRNQGARSLYPQEDSFSRRSTEHYLGFTVEWWFNQSSYP